MGNDSSLPHYDNDYELVVCVCKELESELAEILGLSGNPHTPPLKNMIDRVRDKFSEQTIADMFFLAEKRNKLVHQKGFGRLTDDERSVFRAAYGRVKKQLDLRKPQAAAPAARSEDDSGMGFLAGVAVIGAIAAAAAMAANEESERKKKERNNLW